jgi:hypothetical protein
MSQPGSADVVKESNGHHHFAVPRTFPVPRNGTVLRMPDRRRWTETDDGRIESINPAETGLQYCYLQGRAGQCRRNNISNGGRREGLKLICI